jgi:DNA gyrase/topoisomerase IV subunit A
MTSAQRRVLARLTDTYQRCDKVAATEEEYDALVALAQDFTARYPLVDGVGNFGSQDSDPPADAQYTRARLAPLAHHLDRFPDLLVNGGHGHPPHNLREVAAREILGPDYPTGGVIPEPAPLAAIYATGKGEFRLRARTHAEGDAIVVTELPYGVPKGGEQGVVSEIVELVATRRLKDLADIQDRSDRDRMRLVLGFAPGTDLETALRRLFAHTRLEITVAVDMIAPLGDLLAAMGDIGDLAERFGDDRRTALG